MRKNNVQKKAAGILIAAALTVSLASAFHVMANQEPEADVASSGEAGVSADAAGESGTSASVTRELTDKRAEFVRQFAMSDGSYTAAVYSVPVNYKKSAGTSKSGKWTEIDTTLVKSGKKNYKTKATDLTIKVSKKANKKAVLSMKRGNTALSFALKGKKARAVKVKLSNPKKKTVTDVLNQNTVIYKKVMKNTDISYDIFPEKVQEIVSVNKKQKNKSFSFKVNTGLKVKVKGKRIYFKNKKGAIKFTRMSTIVTDANGVSTSKVKVSYNKKTKTIKVTPNKKWWNSKKRKFPLEIRTTYITDKNSRNVKVGAAYSGAPDSNFSYDKSLLLQADKCVAFTRMSTLSALKGENIQIRDAALHIKNEKALKLGAGKTFDVGIHKVTQNWNASQLTYNNRPAYESAASAVVGLQKAGSYQCDVTAIVKAWYAGEGNYGVALAADNSNRAYQAKLDRNPYFTIHYEIVGFDGAEELKEGTPAVRSVLAAGQENYYYFDAKSDIAYDIYTDSSLDTQAVLYDQDKERIGYDDNSGMGKNFLFTRAYDGRKYIKVSVKDGKTGEYTLRMKQHFKIPQPVGSGGQDKYTLSWGEIENAGEYLVCVYDAGGKTDEITVKGTTCDYVYTNETKGKTLGFTVTAREDEKLCGEASPMIFNTDSQSEWGYTTPMPEKRKNVSAVTLDGKIYVLGGEDGSGSCSSFWVYDTAKETWESLPDYPEAGISRAAMIAYSHEIYVIGGQTESNAGNAKLMKEVYCYQPETGKWQKKADMAEGRTNMAAALCKDSIYIFAKAGNTDKAERYDIKKDSWETVVTPATSTIINAVGIDNRVFVLKEEGGNMLWIEYQPETNLFGDAGTVCPYAASDAYTVPAVISGTIYMAVEGETKQVLAYNAYTDKWSRISDMNLKKSSAILAASGNAVYSIGGEMEGFGVLDVAEKYNSIGQSITKQMAVEKGEAYELQVTAGNLKKGQAKTVTVTVNPDEMQILNASSFEEEEALREGADGVTLIKYQPEKGIIILKLEGTLEQGGAYETYHSIPVEAKTDGETIVKIRIS